MSKSKVTLEKSGRGPDRRDTVVDRRTGIDRRDIPTELNSHRDGKPVVLPDDAVGITRGDQSLETNLERRRGPGRRRTDFMKSAEEGEMSPEQFLFVMAIDAFKRVNNKTFPTWTDVLEVIRKLGYRKTMVSELQLGAKAVDWTEAPDAPCGVFKASDEAA